MAKFEVKKTGISLALAAAGLMTCAANAGELDQNATLAAGSSDLVHCYGVNVCKGHNDCAGANNQCAGQGACDGQGFVAMPSKACADVGGKLQDEWRGEVASADLVHCNGVNVCKGHNDCAGANNSCAGHGECKGQGFVSIPAKACGDIGGSVSG